MIKLVYRIGITFFILIFSGCSNPNVLVQNYQHKAVYKLEPSTNLIFLDYSKDKKMQFILPIHEWYQSWDETKKLFEEKLIKLCNQNGINIKYYIVNPDLFENERTQLFNRIKQHSTEETILVTLKPKEKKLAASGLSQDLSISYELAILELKSNKIIQTSEIIYEVNNAFPISDYVDPFVEQIVQTILSLKTK